MNSLNVYSLESYITGYFIFLWRRWLVMNVLFFKICSFTLFYGRVIGNGSYLLNWVKSSVLKVLWYFYLFGFFLFCFGGFLWVFSSWFWVKFSGYIDSIVSRRKKSLKCWEYSGSLYRKYNFVFFCILFFYICIYKI